MLSIHHDHIIIIMIRVQVQVQVYILLSAVSYRNGEALCVSNILLFFFFFNIIYCSVWAGLFVLLAKTISRFHIRKWIPVILRKKKNKRKTLQFFFSFFLFLHNNYLNEFDISLWPLF